MPLLETDLAIHDAAKGVVLRTSPLRVRWSITDLTTADKHDLSCVFTASVKALDDPIERRTLAEVLMNGRPRVTAQDVSTHFLPALRSAANVTAQDRGIEAWMTSDARSALVESLKAAAQKVAFVCGLEVLAPFELSLESRSYEQEKLRQMQRALAERQAAEQAEHLSRAGKLLEQFSQLRQSAPELSAGQVLEQLNPAERGSMLQSLLLAAAKKEGQLDLWAVAGEYLVRIDARGEGRPTTSLHPLPPTLGPLRSVQPARVQDERVLLVGARGGFMLVWPHDLDREPQVYADPAVQSQLGFSRVVYLGTAGGFIGCHGEAGMVRWGLGRTTGPIATFRPDRFLDPSTRVAPIPAATVATMSTLGPGGTISAVGSRAPGPRNVQALDDARLLFSVGNRLWVMENDDFAQLTPQSEAEVVAVVPGERQMLVVHEDGTLYAVDRVSRQISDLNRRGGRIRAAGGLPWLGGARLLLAEEEGPIECVGLDDPLVTQFGSLYRGLRVVTGSADLVAAVTPDRQRIVYWRSWDGKQPAGEIYLTAQTKHRVADVEFG